MSQRADRSANQTAADEPDSGGRHRQRDARGEPGLILHQLAERRTGPMATGHRDRAGDQADERMHAEQFREQHADTVLRCREPGREQPEQEHLRSAHLEQREAGAKPDRREERDHHRRLQRRVEFERKERTESQRRSEGGEEEPADNRRRDVVATQERDTPAHPVPDEQDKGGDSERLDHVQSYDRHVRARFRRAVGAASA